MESINKGKSIDFTKYFEDSMLSIERTLYKVKEHTFTNLGQSELKLIAVFAASFAIDDWAAEEGVCIRDGILELGKYDRLVEVLKKGAEFGDLNIVYGWNYG